MKLQINKVKVAKIPTRQNLHQMLLNDEGIFQMKVNLKIYRVFLKNHLHKLSENNKSKTKPSLIKSLLDSSRFSRKILLMLAFRLHRDKMKVTQIILMSIPI